MRRFLVWVDPYEETVTLEDLGLEEGATEEEIEEACAAHVNHICNYSVSAGWREQ